MLTMSSIQQLLSHVIHVQDRALNKICTVLPYIIRDDHVTKTRIGKAEQARWS